MAEIDPIRFERIERKIDELGEAFVIMARVEEKIVNLEAARIEGNKRYDDGLSQILTTVRKIEDKQNEQDLLIADNTRVTGYIKWIVGAIVTAVIGAAAIQFFA